MTETNVVDLIENFETEQELKEKARNMIKIPINLDGIKYILKLYLSEEKNSIIFKLIKERTLMHFYFEKFFLHDFRQRSRIFMIDYTITQILAHMKKLIINSEIFAKKKDEFNMIIVIKSLEENKYLLNFELKKVLLAQNQLNLKLDEQINENKSIIEFLNTQITKLTQIVQNKTDIIKHFNNNISNINKSINDINIITNNINNNINNNNKKEDEEKNIKKEKTIEKIEKEKKGENNGTPNQKNVESPPPTKKEENNDKNKNNTETEDKRYISNNRKKKNKKKNKKFFHGENNNKNNQNNNNKSQEENSIFCFENVEIIGNKKIFELLVVFNVIMVLIILCLIGSIYSIKSNLEYEKILEDEFMNKLSYLNVINNYGEDDYVPRMGGIGDWDPNEILFENEQQKAYFKDEIISRENKKIKDVEFILKHKSSRDGKNLDTFFKNCKGVEDNLLLIRNEKGQKFALLSKNLIDVLKGNKVKESQIKKNFIMYNFNKHDIFEYNFSRNFEEIYTSFIKNIFNFFSDKIEFEDSRLKFVGRIVEIEIYEVKFIK